KKAIVFGLLEELADYVNVTCKGDRASILSSGFDVIDGQSSAALDITTLEVVLGAPGVAMLQVKNAAGVVAYMHQYATELPGPNTVWNSEGSTSRSHTFTGLTSDKRYWFRVIAIGRRGQKAYSPVVSKSIQ